MLQLTGDLCWPACPEEHAATWKNLHSNRSTVCFLQGSKKKSERAKEERLSIAAGQKYEAVHDWPVAGRAAKPVLAHNGRVTTRARLYARPSRGYV